MKKYTKHFPNCSKLLLFSAIAMLACSAAQAQNSRHLADTVSGSYGTIVRSYGSNKAVSFFWQAKQPVIALVDFTTYDTYYATLPYKLNIKDMVVLDDYLYFCGTTAGRHTSEQAGLGLIGYIDLLQVITGNIFDINLVYVQATTNLNKLAVYDDGGMKHVVAIGEQQWAAFNYSHSMYFIFNCVDFLQPSVNYDMIQLDPDERPWDVVLTDNLVVFFGYHADPQFNSIYFRKTDKYNILSPELDTVHCYDSVFDSYSRTHTIAVGKDNIVTSYLNIGSQPATYIRTIDAATGTMTHSQQFDMPDKSEPIDLVYSAENGLGVLMEDFYWGSQINSNFVYFDPWPSAAYSSSLEYRPGWLFLSMTLLYNKFHLAGNGAEWYYKYMLSGPSGSPDPSCPEANETILYPIETLEHYRHSRPILSWNITDNMTNIQRATISSTVSIICQDN